MLTLDSYTPTGQSECGCPSCGLVFASDEAFDAHRVGTHQEGRKCSENPSHQGLVMDGKGRWRRGR